MSNNKQSACGHQHVTHDRGTARPESLALGEMAITRRGFVAGAAAVTGTILWSSVSGYSNIFGAQAAAQSQPAGGQPAVGAASNSAGSFHVGRAMADITGEPWGAGMNGYAVSEQTTAGIQRRQFARAFVFVDTTTGQRVAHVTADIGLMFQSIQLEVIRRLRATFGDTYTDRNVVITATHTHTTPGGTSQHLMVDITTLGFRPVTFEAQVNGIVEAITRAHHDASPADITVAIGEVEAVGANRSRQAFDRNPEEERQQFADGVDKRSVTLHVHKQGQHVGFINWHSLHPTSMPHTYQLIHGDNKGYAAWASEVQRGVNHRYPHEANFVAAFANATPGDISANMGLEPGTGPGGEDRNASARILGERMMQGVAQAGSGTPMGSGVTATHRWVDCSSLSVRGEWTPDGQPGKLGPAILGAGFAASSQEDGGGEPLLGFQEGARGGTPWVKELNKITVPPHVQAIHGNKEMLLPVGYLPGLIQQTHCFHIVQLGGLVLVALAFEPTITAGLRMRRTVAAALGVPVEMVVVQGYTSGYGHYITTPEEYDTQNYEGGATVFGRLQLPAFQQVLHDMATAIAQGEPVAAGRPAGDLTGFIPTSPAGNPFIDTPPLGRRFGDVLHGPGQVASGALVNVAFVSANPNNNLRHGEGYLTIENADGHVIGDDNSETTTLTFAKNFLETTATVAWDTTGVPAGKYVVRLRGDARDFFGKITPFEGTAEVVVS